MAASSKFAVAVHALSLLGHSKETLLSSEYIAASVNTNPVVIRRILSSLRKAGLVASQPGNQGGLRLAKPPEAITLADIYQALETEGFIALHGNAPNMRCPVSRNIKSLLGPIFLSTERAVENTLKRTTIADLVKDIRKEDKV